MIERVTQYVPTDPTKAAHGYLVRGGQPDCRCAVGAFLPDEVAPLATGASGFFTVADRAAMHQVFGGSEGLLDLLESTLPFGRATETLALMGVHDASCSLNQNPRAASIAWIEQNVEPDPV